jgi:hypothetical protein
MTMPDARQPPVNADNRRPDTRHLDKDLATQCVHAGERWERPACWSSSTPIHNATTFYSIMVNPARTTHRWLPPETLARIGILPGTFRMSVGIEGVDDLLEALDRALRAPHQFAPVAEDREARPREARGPLVRAVRTD